MSGIFVVFSLVSIKFHYISINQWWHLFPFKDSDYKPHRCLHCSIPRPGFAGKCLAIASILPRVSFKEEATISAGNPKYDVEVVCTPNITWVNATTTPNKLIDKIPGSSLLKAATNIAGSQLRFISKCMAPLGKTVAIPLRNIFPIYLPYPIVRIFRKGERNYIRHFP